MLDNISTLTRSRLPFLALDVSLAFKSDISPMEIHLVWPPVPFTLLVTVKPKVSPISCTFSEDVSLFAGVGGLGSGLGLGSMGGLLYWLGSLYLVISLYLDMDDDRSTDMGLGLLEIITISPSLPSTDDPPNTSSPTQLPMRKKTIASAGNALIESAIAAVLLISDGKDDLISFYPHPFNGHSQLP